MRKIFDYIKLLKKYNTLKVMYDELTKEFANEKERTEEIIETLKKDKWYLICENRELKTKNKALKAKKIDKQFKQNTKKK